MAKKGFFTGGVTGTAASASTRETVVLGKRVLRSMSRGDYGNLTSAFAVVVGEHGYAIDNGTGARNAAAFLKNQGVKKVVVLQTHLHKDHTQGITGSNLWMQKDLITGVYAPKIGDGFEAVVSKEFSPEGWPVSPKRTFGIEHRFVDIAAGEPIADLPEVSTLLLNHPGTSVGYRMPGLQGDVVVTTDVELASDADKQAWAKFVSGAALVYVDIQYRDSEYAGEAGIGGGPKMSRKGWGHSTPSMVLEALKMTAQMPQQILVGHHDPDRDEKELFHFEQEVQSLLGDYVQVAFAHESMEY